jgi:hypothetical protein
MAMECRIVDSWMMPGAMKQMRFTVDATDMVARFRFEGRMGFSEADFELMEKVKQELEQLLDQGCSRIMLNLDSADCVFHSSFNLLINPFLKIAVDKRADLALVCQSLNRRKRIPSVFDRIKAGRIDELIPVVDSEHEALKIHESDESLS